MTATVCAMALTACAIWLVWPAPTAARGERLGRGDRAGVTASGAGAPARPRRRLLGLLPPRAPKPPTADVDDLAAVLDLMALALDSGCAVTDALELVADEVTDPLSGHLRQVVAARRWGVTGADAWKGLPSQWGPVAQALTLAQLAGAPPAETIRRAAADLRRDRRAALERAAARLPVFLVIPLGTVFMPAFVLIAVVPLVVALATQTLGQA
ncbi:type II secretion system F family protein [Kytococcus sedentarius]|uniref:type II secretion system F family protein n=1 Tax=Kytococcus sedentarius TaxID=1276 RepID=UPI0019520DF1|nr:type II secretion system F family protein [Kytococcus sedentarius]QRO87168.1 type II secretion system F family protein [Kytococcus sedentarius]